MTKDYIGRFAPSPTGLLHAGSLVAALASPFIDAKAHHGQWLIRIEDVDESRCKKEWAEGILNVLRQLQMNSDARSFGKAKEKTDTQKSFSHSSILTELTVAAAHDTVSRQSTVKRVYQLTTILVSAAMVLMDLFVPGVFLQTVK